MLLPCVQRDDLCLPPVHPRAQLPQRRASENPTNMQILTLHQKQLIREEFERRKRNGAKATQASLAGWAKEKFRLGSVPNQAVISRMLNSTDDLKTSRKGLIKNRAAAAPRLETALVKWIRDQNNNGVALNSEIVIMKAKQMLNEANRHLPDGENLTLKFSNGWMQRFKKRHQIRFRRVYGEANSADTEAIKKEMPGLLRVIRTYAHKDVWNADEFGLFYRQPPTWSLSNTSVTGFKKEKSRLTFLACCNNDGSEKFPLMIIGNAERPRPFNRKYGRELGLDYYANKKAWMNMQLFHAWLHRFDAYIGRTPGRKVLLLIDNCSAHGCKSSIPELQNVLVEFLPPNTTSKIQPLDAGIIAWVKAKYKRRLLLRVFENLESSKKSIYNVDVLTAIRWTEQEWANCPPKVIFNCFTHCWKLETTDEEGTIADETLHYMARDAEEHGLRVSKANLEFLLIPTEENSVTKEVTLEELGKEIAGVDDPESEEDEGSEDEELYPNATVQLQSLNAAKATLERHGHLNEDYRKAFYECQRALRLEKQRSMTQTTIEDHFGKK